MTKRILIANRGEIACRIARAAHAMGYEAVAVYSDADRFARHVRMADHAVHIGPAPATESYLRADLILQAAKESGADAIHPGYGFLSENPDFADAVEAAGLAWIGPKGDTIRAMGLKDEAKRIAEEAGVPVLPGYRGADQSLETLAKEAKRIGYPLLIKAVAGGGGRGIREVREASALAGELESAVREAKSAFGDGRVMLEKLVEQPRHIEVQVFGDGEGGAVHLYERDCSLQRRRQKVVEEAPAPGMPEQVRRAMTAAAVQLAKAVKYRGAGTIEFIVDGARPLDLGSFHFLEMNTRLQVEHPVTEMITGVDLVAWQIALAFGELALPKQSAIVMRGHAIEARICAEDPANGFRPSAGRLALFEPGPEPAEPVIRRWETGFESGDTVPAQYDSMLAKLVILAPDRDSAVAATAGALGRVRLAGLTGNTGFLRRCVLSEPFVEGSHHVNWIASEIDALTAPLPGFTDAAIAAAAQALAPVGDGSVWGVPDGFRLNAPPRARLWLQEQGGAAETVHEADLMALPAPDPALETVRVSQDEVLVLGHGESLRLRVPSYLSDAEAAGSGDVLKAPMPGKLTSVRVSAGDAVTKGQALATMEAMKMEHTLAAPRDGVVAEVKAAPGAQLADGDVILTLETEV